MSPVDLNLIFEKSSLKNQDGQKIKLFFKLFQNQVQINRESSKNEACAKWGTHKCYNSSLVTPESEIDVDP